jgi:BirA family biotin operon repressor/biotin-[acetyl-CoA-carboxylase] ligase
VSPPGNLFLSVLLRPVGSARHAGMWGLLGAVAVADAVAPLLPDASALRLKWPNDVLLAGAKLAGLLSEAALGADGDLDWLVIGMGVNLASAPAVPDRPTACVGPGAPSPERFAVDLLARLDAWRMRVLLDGWTPLRAAWLARGPAMGEPISVRLGGETRTGEFAGLAEDGALRLSCDGVVRTFAAGET